MSPGDECSDDTPPAVSRETFVETMASCLNRETRAADASPCDPLELKSDWTSNLP